MSPVPSVSVVIPSNHAHHELLKAVTAVCCQTLKPAEIVIVDSSTERGTLPKQLVALCASTRIGLIYEHLALSLPGQARNIGLGMAQGEFIAFIDVQTIPRPHWLQASSELLTGHGSDGVWGATCFRAANSFEGLVRDSLFGVQPRRTLPGSVFKKVVFQKSGLFIDWVRAGEDTEWMLRLELLKIPVALPTMATIDYVGLIGSDLKTLVKKWYRNYSASRELPHFFPQKMVLWLVLYPLLILIAFNWNYLIADWRMDSPLYIGHITKIATILPPLGYVFTRGIFFPLGRGVGFSRILPIRFIAISLICLIADAVKALAFTIPKRKNGGRSRQADRDCA